jgi:hypothetical protein
MYRSFDFAAVAVYIEIRAVERGREEYYVGD